MKMVSAAKMRGDTNRLDAAKPFAAWTDALGSSAQAIEFIDTSDFPKTNLFVAFSTDKGLCGGVNSFITRGMRKVGGMLANEGKTFQMVVYGEKGRGQQRRLFEDNMVVSCTDAVYPATFSTVCGVTNEVLKVDPSQYEAMHLVYNEFKSAIAYTPTVKTMPTLGGEGINEPLVQYEFEPGTKSEVIADLQEFMLASSMFYSVMGASHCNGSTRKKPVASLVSSSFCRECRLGAVCPHGRHGECQQECR